MRASGNSFKVVSSVSSGVSLNTVNDLTFLLSMTGYLCTLSCVVLLLLFAVEVVVAGALIGFVFLLSC